MATLFQPESEICPVCRKLWIEHDGTKALCAKVHQAIIRVYLVQQMAEGTSDAQMNGDLKAIADICKIIISELKS